MPSTKSHASSDSHLKTLNLGTGNVPQTPWPWCAGGSDDAGAPRGGSGSVQKMAVGTNDDSHGCQVLWFPPFRRTHAGKACWLCWLFGVNLYHYLRWDLTLALQGICFHTFIGCAENQAFLRLFWYLLLGKINHDIYMLIGFDWFSQEMTTGAPFSYLNISA